MATQLKTILQNVAGAVGTEIPTTFVGNTGNETAQRLLAAARQAGRALQTEHDWRALTFEATTSTSAGTLVYALPTSPNFSRIKVDAGYDRTDNERLLGPLTGHAWQKETAEGIGDLRSRRRWRIRPQKATAGRPIKFEFLDDPGSRTVAFDYVTDEWLYDGSSSYYATPNADVDQVLYDEYMFELHVHWRFLRALGLPFASEALEAQQVTDAAKGHEIGARITLSDPGLVLPAQTPETNIGV